MGDPVAYAAIDVLTSLVTPALFTDEKLRCLLIGRMGNLSVEHGNCDASCYVYTSVGNVRVSTSATMHRDFALPSWGSTLLRNREWSD